MLENLFITRARFEFTSDRERRISLLSTTLHLFRRLPINLYFLKDKWRHNVFQRLHSSRALVQDSGDNQLGRRFSKGILRYYIVARKSEKRHFFFSVRGRARSDTSVCNTRQRRARKEERGCTKKSWTHEGCFSYTDYLRSVLSWAKVRCVVVPRIRWNRERSDTKVNIRSYEMNCAY